MLIRITTCIGWILAVGTEKNSKSNSFYIFYEGNIM